MFISLFFSFLRALHRDSVYLVFFFCLHRENMSPIFLSGSHFSYFLSSFFSLSFLLDNQLALLDRLLARCMVAKSRVLVFSQFTLTLDVLEEYCEAKFGPKGSAFLRLDGTNMIK